MNHVIHMSIDRIQWRFRSGFLASLMGSLIFSVVSAAAAPQDRPTWQHRERERIAVIQRVSPTVVCVMPPGGQGGGSGVLISADGYAVTNFHVTSGSGSFLKCGLNDGQIYDTRVNRTNYVSA